MKKCTHLYRQAMLILLSASCTCIGYAQDNQTTVPTEHKESSETFLDLNDITVVTPSRSEMPSLDTPYSVYRIGESDIRMTKAYSTTPDALQNLPSVMVQKTSQGQGSPYLRGFTGFRTLCLIDGIRLNNAVFRDGPNQYWNTIDPLSIHAYEVVMGPGSVMYGSDAIGGTLNALTIMPPIYTDKRTWNPSLYYRGASAENSNIGRLQLGTAINPYLSFFGGISIKDFGDVKGGKDVGTQEHTGYQEMDWDARFDITLNEQNKLILAHQTVDIDDAWRTHKTIYGIDWHDVTIGNEKKRSLDQHRQLTYLQYHGSELEGFIDDVRLSLSCQQQQEDQDRIKKDDARDTQGFDVTTWGATAQCESETEIGNWVYGVEYYHDEVSSYKHKYNDDGTYQSDIQGPVADDATYDTLGVFLQDTLSCCNQHLDIVPGARYSYAKLDANKVKDPLTGKQMSMDDHWDDVVGSLRMLYRISPDYVLVPFAGISQGFRAPNLSDLTRLDTARSNEIETPVKNLDPEKYIAYELGIKGEFNRLATELTWYYTDIDNMIVRTPTGRIIDGNEEVTKKNAGEGWITGIDFMGTLNLTEDWCTWVVASWMDGKVDTYPTSEPVKEREYISRLMPPTAQVGIRWNNHENHFWIESKCNMAGKADKLSTSDESDTQRIPPGGTPGYAVFDIKAGLNISKHTQLSLALENIFDKDYRIHGSGINEPGRNLVFAMNVTF